MSYTEIYVIDENGDVLPRFEISNSHGIPQVWDAMLKKYCGGGLWIMDPDLFPKLAAAMDRMTEHEVASLKWTYDKVVVARDNIPKLCESIKIFADQHIPETITQGFRKSGEALQRIYDEYPDALGAAMHATSIVESFWVKYEPGDSEDEDDDYRPHNVHTDEGHWELYGDDDKLAKEAA
jgi:hypothetical protein